MEVQNERTRTKVTPRDPSTMPLGMAVRDPAEAKGYSSALGVCGQLQMRWGHPRS